MGNIDLSIIIVNYNSTAFLIDCFNSIRDKIKGFSYEVFIIDSGSRKEDVENLKLLDKFTNVNLIFEKENVGYAKAVNKGFKLSKGDYILITNPDIIYLQNSIKVLIEAINILPYCGAVSPKVWWDEEKTFLLPYNEFISPYIIFKKNISKRISFLKRVVLKKWLEMTIYYWKAENPVEVDLGSGSCILTRKDVIDKVGWFDERFPLYFEDTDWFLRVKKEGYKLYCVPEAEVIHYYNQSAKQDMELSLSKFNQSMEMYLEKHFKKEKFLFEFFNKIINTFKSRKTYFKDLGELKEPLKIQVNNNIDKLALLSPNENLIPSAGNFFNDNYFEINKNIWDRLSVGRYFAKVFALNRFKEIESYSFYKK